MPTIIEMVNHTRLDCVLGVAAGHALGHRGGDPPLHPSGGVRQAAGGAAADAKRARRPGDRIGGGDGRRDAAGARLRRGARRRRGAAVGAPAPRDPGAQVLDLQARPGPRGRGAGVPGRQRLRRGVGHAAALPGEPARLDLGGVGERPMPRRPARDGRATRRRSRPSSPRSRRRSGAEPRVDAAVAALRDELVRPRGDRVPRPPRGRADGAGAPGLAAGPLRRPGGRRRVLRLAPGGRRRACAFGTLPAGTDFGRIIERHAPSV